MVNLIAWIVLGTVLGMAAGMLMRRRAPREVLLNIMAGTAGATIVGLLITPLVGIGHANPNLVNGQALILSLFGAVVTLSTFIVIRHTPQL
jgi:uncharacterized membrane protein YeaQ/YmgE (transglycosylase-associated protein family)